MQPFRDAATLLVLVLLVLTVRVPADDADRSNAAPKEPVRTASVLPGSGSATVVPHDAPDLHVADLRLPEAVLVPADRRHAAPEADDREMVVRIGESTWVFSIDVEETEAETAEHVEEIEVRTPCDPRLARLTS